VAKANAKKRESLTEHNIRSAWAQTIHDLDLANRETETNDKAGREAIDDIVREVERSHKLPWFGIKHVQAIRYAGFVRRLRQANLDKHISQEIV